MPAPWLAQLSDNLEEVINAESLELQAIFNSDHLVCSVGPCVLHQLLCSICADHFEPLRGGVLCIPTMLSA